MSASLTFRQAISSLTSTQSSELSALMLQLLFLILEGRGKTLELARLSTPLEVQMWTTQRRLSFPLKTSITHDLMAAKIKEEACHLVGVPLRPLLNCSLIGATSFVAGGCEDINFFTVSKNFGTFLEFVHIQMNDLQLWV